MIVFDDHDEEVSSSRPIYVLHLSYQLPSQRSMYTVSACASEQSTYLVYLPNLGAPPRARVRGPYSKAYQYGQILPMMLYSSINHGSVDSEMESDATALRKECAYSRVGA